MHEADKVLEYIDQHSDELVQFLCQLVRIRSTVPPGRYEEIAELLESEYEKIGVESKLISAPQKNIVSRGLTYPRPNVLALLRGVKERPVLMITTHLDVVLAEDSELWRFDPFAGVVNDNKIWGRGTCDNKCTIAAQLFVAKAILQSQVKLNGSLLLVASVDDEGRLDKFKWPGMSFLVETGFKEAKFPLPDMAINGEASGLQNICGSFKGRIIREIEVLGETAHASTPYGVNAVEKALKLVSAFKEIELMVNPIQGKDTITLCEFSGVAERFGDIPPFAKIGYDVRVVAPQNTDRIKNLMWQKIKDLQQSDPDFHIGKLTIMSDRQPIEISKDHVLIRSIKEAAREIGIDANYASILGTGELQTLLAEGIPSVTYGPGDISRVHRRNEFIKVDELLEQAKIYALTVLKICGYQT